MKLVLLALLSVVLFADSKKEVAAKAKEEAINAENQRLIEQVRTLNVKILDLQKQILELQKQYHVANSRKVDGLLELNHEQNSKLAEVDDRARENNIHIATNTIKLERQGQGFAAVEAALAAQAKTAMFWNIGLLTVMTIGFLLVLHLLRAIRCLLKRECSDRPLN